MLGTIIAQVVIQLPAGTRTCHAARLKEWKYFVGLKKVPTTLTGPPLAMPGSKSGCPCLGSNVGRGRWVAVAVAIGQGEMP